MAKHKWVYNCGRSNFTLFIRACPISLISRLANLRPHLVESTNPGGFFFKVPEKSGGNDPKKRGKGWGGGGNFFVEIFFGRRLDMSERKS